MKNKQRIRKGLLRGDGEIDITHGHGEYEDFLGLSLSPEFKSCKGYREFVLKAAEHFGGKVPKRDLNTSSRSYPHIWGTIDGELWNGAEMIGHKEIADLAEFFHREFVRKYQRGAATRIFVQYEKLTPEKIFRMTYNERKVFEFEIEETY